MNEIVFGLLFIFAAIGLSILILLSIRLLISIAPHFFPEQNLSQKYGHSAVVIGGTDGMGLLIVKKLISQNISVFCVGFQTENLTQEDLPEGSTLINGSISDSSIMDAVLNHIKVNKPSLLFNCAALCIPQRFIQTDNPKKYVETYIGTLTQLTQAFLINAINDHQGKNNKYGIVFFSSQVYMFSSPFASLYSSTKAFTNQFARSLSAEYPQVDFLVLNPGAVNETSFFKYFPNFWYFKILSFLGEKKSSVVSLIFRSIGRIHVIDTGIYTYLTRIIVSLFDDNIIDFCASRMSSSVFDQIEKEKKYLNAPKIYN